MSYKVIDHWVSVTCTNCQRAIGYDNDDYLDIQALKCPHCRRWFYMAKANIEVIPVKRDVITGDFYSHGYDEK